MASNFVVNFIGNNKLSKTTAVISRDLQKMGRTADKVSGSLKSAFSVAGVGLSVMALTSYIKDSAKAAAADSKSQAQLALALKNTLGATQTNIAGAEEFIQKLSNQVAIVDDELRPALATAVRATGSLTQAQDLLTLATDISAGTGKDLGVVTKALAKAQAGQLAGLQKLIPGIKAGSNWMGQLKTQFAGAAVAAAKTDPYQRVSVIMDNLKETIGAALLPYMQQLADYLASPKGQAEIKKLAGEFAKLAKIMGQTVMFLVKNIDTIKVLLGLLVTLRISWNVGTTAVKLYTMATAGATAATRTLKLAIASTGIGALIVLFGELAVAVAEYDQSTAKFNQKSYRGYQFDSYDQKRSMDAEQSRWIAMGKFFKEQKTKIIDQQKELNKELAKTGEKFRDAVGLAFGTFGKDEYSVFNVDVVINKLKRMVDAAKGFAENIKKLAKQGAGQDVINELINMGPAQGNIVAQGLLKSGRLSEYLGLRGSLYQTGTQVQTVSNAATTANYTINLNKANVSATDIINAIRQYEKKTGRKYFAN